jgi:hypothetical protein
VIENKGEKKYGKVKSVKGKGVVGGKTGRVSKETT